MATKKASQKWTLAEKKEHIEKIHKLVAKLKRENKLENFTAITPEQIEEKFKRINSPFIIGMSWGLLPGGNYDYNVTVYNPDPVTADHHCVHVWVGSGNVDPNIGTFLLNVDTRFPRLLSQEFSLASGAATTLYFLLEVPSTVQKTGYMVNSCLMQLDCYGTGMYVDRGCMVIEVH